MCTSTKRKRINSPTGRAPSLPPEARSSQSGPEHVAAAPLAAEPLLQFDLGDWRRRVQVDPRPLCAAKGIKVSDAEMASLNITRDAFHPEWNYSIAPSNKNM